MDLIHPWEHWDDILAHGFIRGSIGNKSFFMNRFNGFLDHIILAK
jgi:hypothetical protein